MIGESCFIRHSQFPIFFHVKKKTEQSHNINPESGERGDC